jgi:hypothetical protein
MVPQEGTYYGTEDVIISRANGRIYVFPNECAHRQARMVEPGVRGYGDIICPAHGWKLSITGEAMPRLNFTVLHCGLIFEGNAPYISPLLDLHDWVYESRNKTVYQGDWRTFMEVYAETLHIPIIHKMLGSMVGDCSESEMEVWPTGMVQVVKGGVVWHVEWPYFMMEWYPGFMVISYLREVKRDQYTNIVEYYFRKDAGETIKAASMHFYESTAKEDYILCQRLEAGRRGQYPIGGPYAYPQETTLQQFHEWLKPHEANI